MKLIMKFLKFLKMVKMCFHLFSKQILLSPPSPPPFGHHPIPPLATYDHESPPATLVQAPPTFWWALAIRRSLHVSFGDTLPTNSSGHLQPSALPTISVHPPLLAATLGNSPNMFFIYMYMFVFKFFMYTKQKNKRSSFPVFGRQKLGNQHCYQTTPY